MFIPLSVFVPFVNVFYCQEIYSTFFISFFASYLLLAVALVVVLFYLVFKTAREQLREHKVRTERTVSIVHVSNGGAADAADGVASGAAGNNCTAPHRRSQIYKKTRVFYHNIGYDLNLFKCYVIIVGSTFIAYLLPIFVFYVSLMNIIEYRTLMKLQVLSGALATVNNSLNPFVYFYSQNKMRKYLRKLLNRGSDRRRKQQIVREIKEALRIESRFPTTATAHRNKFFRRPNPVVVSPAVTSNYPNCSMNKYGAMHQTRNLADEKVKNGNKSVSFANSYQIASI